MEKVKVKINHELDETVSIVYEDEKVIIYEGGWWMKRGDWNKLWDVIPGDRSATRFHRPGVFVQRDKKSRQLTIGYVPY